jgi:hypothetical protein
MYIAGRNIIAIIVAALVIGAVCLVGLNAQKQTPAATINPQTVNTESVGSVTTITFTGTEFKPKQTAIGANGQLRFRNESQKDLIITSENQEFGIIGTLKPNESKTYYFNQKGTWEFHNSQNEKQNGTLVIQ